VDRKEGTGRTNAVKGTDAKLIKKRQWVTQQTFIDFIGRDWDNKAASCGNLACGICCQFYWDCLFSVNIWIWNWISLWVFTRHIIIWHFILNITERAVVSRIQFHMTWHNTSLPMNLVQVTIKISSSFDESIESRSQCFAKLFANKCVFILFWKETYGESYKTKYWLWIYLKI
jgi:hypothetical protein